MILSDIRKLARESLSGKWKKGVLITLMYFVLELVLGYISKLVERIPVLSFLISIGVLVISIPIAFGIILSFMKLKRGEEVKCYDFFSLGFANFIRSWKLTGNILLKLWLPILLYLLATIMLAFFITFGVIASTLVHSSILLILVSIIGIGLFIASFIYLFISALSYSLTYMIAYDNETMKEKEVVEKSKKWMTGNRGKYLLLQLSFLGWAILSIFTLYIGILWLVPYMQVTMICFYETLKEEKIEEE